MPAQFPGNAVSKAARSKTGGGFESAFFIETAAGPVKINLAANSIDPDSWQATLGAEFDIVETFDHLQDWTGTDAPSNTEGLPVLTDGSPGMWGRFTNDRRSVGVDSITGFLPEDGGGETVNFSSGASGRLWSTFTEEGQAYLMMSNNSGVVSPGDTATGATSGATATVQSIPDWIKDHGLEYTFRDGKSACINYNDFSNNPDGFGPSRLEMFFGNGETGKSGYKKVHLFFMLKFGADFFPRNEDGTFKDVGVIKVLEIETGFTAVDKYGTDADRLEVIDRTQNLRDYGNNLTFLNMEGGGLSSPNSLYFKESRFVADQKTSGLWGYDDAPSSPRRIGETAGLDGDIADDYLASKWLGMEFILDTGTVGNSDGTNMEMYIYDENGTELHHVASSPSLALVHFDHLYNKIVFGGNRIGPGYEIDYVQNSRYYIDDVIVHGDRIAPTYFQKLAERV